MNVYEQIDRVFSDSETAVPVWAREMLEHLRFIRNILEHSGIDRMSRSSYCNDSDFYEFVRKFRIIMRADISKERYPTLKYHGRELGVDFNGYLYDKGTGGILSTKEAFKIYRDLYERVSRIKNSLKINQ